MNGSEPGKQQYTPNVDWIGHFTTRSTPCHFPSEGLLTFSKNPHKSKSFLEQH
jgi:hypothetical protein